MPITQWIHVNDMPGNYWALRISGAANTASKGFRPKERELGLYIRIKLEIIRRIHSRLRNETQQIYQLITTHEKTHIFTPTQEGLAFPINDDLKYCLLADSEALIFELRACWQIVKRFTFLIHDLVGIQFPRKQIDSKINAILSQKSHDNQWISLLITHRDFMSHIGGVYIAIDISSSNSNEWDLLLMKSNIKNFDIREDYIPFSEIDHIVNQFLDAMDILQEYLIKLFDTPSL